MATLRQIALEFDPTTALAEEPGSPVPEAVKPKRGRKPKATPLTPKEPSKRGRLSLKEADEASELVNIPPDEELFTKHYYTIGQVADMFRVNHSLLRMWSKEFGSFLQTRTNKKGDRYFRPEDVKTLYLIHHLVRQRKFTMQGAKDFIRKNKNADERFVMVQSLQKIKGFLLEIKATL